MGDTVDLDSNLSVAQDRADKKSHFNCWGATQFVLGQAEDLWWVGVGEMLAWLKNATKKIYGPRKKGDVLVITRYGGMQLIHTAVYVGGGLYFHKRGGNHAETTDLKEVMKTYPGDKHYVRLKES